MSVPTIAVVCCGALLLALALMLSGVLAEPYLVLALPVALVIGAFLFYQPFWGLLLLVALSQLDTFANLMSEGLPISVIKLLTLAILGVIIIQGYREPHRDRLGPREPALKFALLYCVTLLLAGLFAEDTDSALWSIRRLLGLVILFYLIVRMVREQRQLELMLLVIVGSTFFSSLVVIYDSLFGGNLLATSTAATGIEFEGAARSAGASDQNPTTAATMLLAGTLLALFLAIRRPKWRWFNAMAASIGSMAIIFSLARSSALAFGLGIAWLVWKYRRHRHFPVVVATVMLSGVAALPFVPSTYWERLESLGNIDSDISLQRRIGYTQIGIELLAENPVLGVGPGNFRYHYIDEPYRTYKGRKLTPRALHNMFLSVAVEVGLVGLACFLGIMLAGIIGSGDAARRAQSADLRVLAEAIQFSFIPYLLASLFIPNEYNKYTWILAGLAVAVTRIADLPRPQASLIFGKRTS